VNLYVDSSALLKRYVAEPGSELVVSSLDEAGRVVSARHTTVEVRRNLARLLDGKDLTDARQQFERDILSIGLLELDAATCEAAALVAEATGVRTLDALHLGAAQRAGGPALVFLTFDLRQAQAARALGFTVIGV
jgi:predicted nucleic acid-binding protein